MDYYAHTRPQLLRFVPVDARDILEIGCGEGYFGATVKERLPGARYRGIEPNPAAAAKAGARLDSAFTGTFGDYAASHSLAGVDLLVCNDVLEHMADPGEVFRRLEREAPGCRVLFSVPNVRYVEVIHGLLLKGDWRYVDEGVLDRTHLRFFTRRSFDRFAGEHGLVPVDSAMVGPCKSKAFRFLSFLAMGLLDEFKHMQYAGLLVRRGAAGASASPSPSAASPAPPPPRPG